MAKEAKPKDLEFTHPKGHIRDRIIIHDNGRLPKGGVFMSLNGFAFLAQPGVEIDLPRPVRLMLDTLVETETRKDNDGKSYTRNIQRIPYMLVKEGVNVDENGKVFELNEDGTPKIEPKIEAKVGASPS